KGPDAWDEQLRTDFKRETLRIKRGINEVHNKVLDFMRRAVSLKNNPVSAAITRDLIQDADIEYILGKGNAATERADNDPLNELAVRRAGDRLRDGSPLLRQFDEAARILVHGPNNSGGTIDLRENSNSECLALLTEKADAAP